MWNNIRTKQKKIKKAVLRKNLATLLKKQWKGNKNSSTPIKTGKRSILKTRVSYTNITPFSATLQSSEARDKNKKPEQSTAAYIYEAKTDKNSHFTERGPPNPVIHFKHWHENTNESPKQFIALNPFKAGLTEALATESRASRLHLILNIAPWNTRPGPNELSIHPFSPSTSIIASQLPSFPNEIYRDQHSLRHETLPRTANLHSIPTTYSSRPNLRTVGVSPVQASQQRVTGA